MRSDARQIKDQACPAEGAADEPGRFLELDLTAALRAGKLHGVGGLMASPQLVQNFVPGGTTMLQCRQLTTAFKFTPQAGQKFARAVTFLPHWVHLFATTI